MNSTKRIVVNTFAQYFRSIVNTLLSLFSTRIIMQALGVDDYGIYAVVGGVVSMIGFVNNALSTTTQRYISYNMDDAEKSRAIFINSFFIHLVFSVFIVLVMLSLTNVVVDKCLVIDDSRIYAAKVVYVIVAFILIIGVMTAPFRATIIAHENIVFVSIIDVCDGILKFCFAFVLLYVSADKLIAYGLILLGIQLFNLLALSVYSIVKYSECVVFIHRRDLSKKYIKTLTGFIGWTTYSMGIISVRNQGIAVILNHFVGVVVNAAYGLASTMYGYVAFVATSVLNAMNPRIMQAEGRHDRVEMLRLATLESKYSTVLLILCCTPVILEMNTILGLWLKTVPDGAPMFCQMMLLAFICDQSTYGLNTANLATGEIRNYILIIYTPKLLLVGMVWCSMALGYSTFVVMFLYLIVEIFSAIVRIPYLSHQCGLNVRSYVKDVYLRLAPLVAVECALGGLILQFPESLGRLLVTLLSTTVLGCIVSVFVVVSRSEREQFVTAIKSKS